MKKIYEVDWWENRTVRCSAKVEWDDEKEDYTDPYELATDQAAWLPDTYFEETKEVTDKGLVNYKEVQHESN